MSPGLRPLRIRLLTVATVLVLLATPARGAGLLDPFLRFRQVRTAHFTIYFHQGEERLAARLAAMAEEVRVKVGGALGTEPPARTHVILADQSESANGWATPLPRNTVFLNAAAPSGADFIGRTDDWLRLVFTHEYTHIVHLDRTRGVARLARGVLGRSAVAFPNLWLPQWQVEGLATFEESVLTGQGRLHAGDFRAIERVSATTGATLSLDRASGGLVRWPGGHAAYASGLGFHAYLVDRFGEASLGRLATATAGRVPLFGSGAFRGIYGQSLGSLWRDYAAALVASAPARLATDSTQLTHRGYVQAGPRFVPAACPSCPATVVYASQSPDGFPDLRSVGIDGTGDRQLTTRYLGSTIGVSDRVLVFDQQELHRDVAMLSDLYALDRPSGTVTALSRGARLQDPDLSPNGRFVAAVREARGRRDLVVAELRRGADGLTLSAAQTLASESDTQFGAPRWSPDGRFIAAERHRLGALPDVVVIEHATGAVQHTVADRSARIVTPAWRPDGRAVVAAADFDEGWFELYEFALDGRPEARRLTRTTGALWPDVSADGQRLTFAGYTARGYDVFVAPYQLSDEPARALLESALPPSRPAAFEPLTSTGYSPFSTLAPTSWTPLLVAASDQTRVGGTVFGGDVLDRHAYGVSLSWLVDGPSVVPPVRAAVPDWSAVYAYRRWTPSYFGSASRETLFRRVRLNASSSAVEVAVIQEQQQAGILLPLVHVRTSAQALASVVRTESRYRLSAGDRTSTLVAARAALARDTTQRQGYSISRETGLNTGATLELARTALGSTANATTATADVRAYLPGASLHHVVALRAAAGSSTGLDLARQAFQVGAASASPSVIDFGSSALGLFRGATRGTPSGSRLLVTNAEYRLPLAIVERGGGTLPLLMRTLHASVFVDAARLRGSPIASDEGWRRAAGAELSTDVVIGYALPIAASVGVAWSDGAGGSHGATLYARLGRAF